MQPLDVIKHLQIGEDESVVQVMLALRQGEVILSRKKFHLDYAWKLDSYHSVILTITFINIEFI